MSLQNCVMLNVLGPGSTNPVLTCVQQQSTNTHKNTNQTTHAVNCHMHVIVPLCYKLNVGIAHTYKVQIFQFLDIDTAGSKQKHATY